VAQSAEGFFYKSGTLFVPHLPFYVVNHLYDFSLSSPTYFLVGEGVVAVEIISKPATSDEGMIDMFYLRIFR
jgi:hypothetical protein